jgi:hypothetical protein
MRQKNTNKVEKRQKVKHPKNAPKDVVTKKHTYKH